MKGNPKVYVDDMDAATAQAFFNEVSEWASRSDLTAEQREQAAWDLQDLGNRMRELKEAR